MNPGKMVASNCAQIQRQAGPILAGGVGDVWARSGPHWPHGPLFEKHLRPLINAEEDCYEEIIDNAASGAALVEFIKNLPELSRSIKTESHAGNDADANARLAEGRANLVFAMSVAVNDEPPDSDSGDGTLISPYDAEYPPVIRQLIHEVGRAVIAELTFLYAAHCGDQLRPWLRKALAEDYCRGTYALIRLSSLDEDVEIPERFLPAHDRLNARELFSTNMEFVDWMDEQLTSGTGDFHFATFDPQSH
jgi:hypothetical protein